MFKKYNSIENTYREEFLKRIKGHGFWDDTYVVQEKVHGANLSYFTKDGLHFQAAKRTGIIEANEPFHNYEVILETLKPQFSNIYNALKKQYSNLEQMTIFGELIGGDYPHPEVPKNKKSKLVQKGVYYSPDNVFYAFDILLNTEKYLDVKEANAYFEAEGLLYAQTLFEGSIKECMAYSNQFDSTIPAILDLPVLSPNFCEGVIIRPLQTRHFNGGSRVLLKNKNEKWSENKKYHKTIKQDAKLPEKLLQLQEAIAGYVTENRLNNVLSKIGEVTYKDFGKVLGMFQKDIVDDFRKDFATTLADLEKKEAKLVTSSISKAATKLVDEAIF